MAKLNYENVDALVYDPVALHCDATRAVLHTLGFHNVQTAPAFGEFTDALLKRSPDLILCEAQGAEVELCDLIQSLRQGNSGHPNPFLVVIITAWEKTHTLVRRVLNSGADDLILRPFSTNLLRQHVDSHVERRKRFVVTHDYVGPDRRNDPARASTGELFEPPNSLKMKALIGLTGAEAQTRLSCELRTAKNTIHNQKLRRDGFHVCILWRLLQKQDGSEAELNLTELANLTQDIAKRFRGTKFVAGTPLCESILTAVEGLRLGVDRGANMQLLGRAALDLNQFLQPETFKTDHIRAIEQTVEMIHARSVSRASAGDPLLAADSA
jgi:DNA-binding response OmpR family regulator